MWRVILFLGQILIKSRMFNIKVDFYYCRTQVETLRKELEEQEASYKSQISSHEQKAHENWVRTFVLEDGHYLSLLVKLLSHIFL